MAKLKGKTSPKITPAVHKSGSIATTTAIPKAVRHKLIVYLLVFAAILIAVLWTNSRQSSTKTGVNCGTATVTLPSRRSPFSGCFDQNFKQCLPASIRVVTQLQQLKTAPPTNISQVNYQVIGQKGPSCNVSWHFTKFEVNRPLVGQDITCPYNNKLEFKAALNENAIYSGCQGPLLTALKQPPR